MGWRVRAPRRRMELEVAACHASEWASALRTSSWRVKSALVGPLRRNIGQRFRALLRSHLGSSCERWRTAPLLPRLCDLIRTGPCVPIPNLRERQPTAATGLGAPACGAAPNTSLLAPRGYLGLRGGPTLAIGPRLGYLPQVIGGRSGPGEVQYPTTCSSCQPSQERCAQSSFGSL